MLAVYFALLICPFISVIITVPFVILQYQKTRVINVIRSANIYLLIFFTLCAYFLTMLPFPTMEIVAGMTSSYVQPIPFYCIYDFFANSGIVISDWTTVLPAFGGGIMLGIVLNVAMLMPTGFFFKRVFNAKLSQVIVAGFLISLFFEFTQLTGVFHIYPRPYRIFDIDDLIQNTLGFVTGAQLSYVWRLLKAPTHLVIRQGGEVSFRRRVMSGVVDQGILNGIILLTIFITKRKITFFAIHPLKSFPIYFAYIMVLNLVLSFITYMLDGKTLGMYLFGLRLKDIRGNKLSLWQCVVRGVIAGLFINLPLLIGWFIKLSVNRHIALSILCVIVAAELVFSYVFFILTLALHIVTHGEKLMYEKVSKTHLGLEAETVIRNRQQVLYRGKLLPEMIDDGSTAIYNLLIEKEVEKKQCLKMKSVVEAALIYWMEHGLKGHVFTVQIDKRLSKRTLLVCVNGKYVHVEEVEGEDNSIFEAISGTRLICDTYYTGGINVFAVEI